MAYFLTSSSEAAVPAESLTTPKTHTPLSRLQKRGQRYYSPSLGRWLSRDPIEEQGGPNTYEFAGNAPTVLIDAFGLHSLPSGYSFRMYNSGLPWDYDTAVVGRQYVGIEQKRGDKAQCLVHKLLEGHWPDIPPNVDWSITHMASLPGRHGLTREFSWGNTHKHIFIADPTPGAEYDLGPMLVWGTTLTHEAYHNSHWTASEDLVGSIDALTSSSAQSAMADKSRGCCNNQSSVTPWTYRNRFERLACECDIDLGWLVGNLFPNN
jgi:RHS repeat-associated protein